MHLAFGTIAWDGQPDNDFSRLSDAVHSVEVREEATVRVGSTVAPGPASSYSYTDHPVCVVTVFGKILNRSALAAELRIEVADDAATVAALFASGADVPAKLEGEYAIAIYEKKTAAVHLLRDRAGLKAIFYSFKNGRLAWCTTLKPLLSLDWVSRIVDVAALEQFWFLEWTIPPVTAWQDIRQVMNGEIISFTATKQSSRQYHAPRFVPKKPVTKEQATSSVRESILTVARDYTNAIAGDFAVLLSGGVDSNVVLAALCILGRKPSLAVTFRAKGDADESEISAIAAKHFGVNHEIVLQPQAKLIEQVRELVDLRAEPYCHSSVMAILSMMPGITSRASILLTGDGGGEAFLGPASAFDRNIHRLATFFGWAATPMRACSQSLYPAFGMKSPFWRKADFGLELLTARNDCARWLAGRTITRSETAALIGNRARRFKKSAVESRLASLAAVDHDPAEDQAFTVCAPFAWNANAIYAKTQRVAESYGVQAFSPLTDHRFAQTVMDFPFAIKGTRKQTLRDAFRSDVAPAIYDAPKKGLATNTREALALDQAAIRSVLLAPTQSMFFDLFNPAAIAKMFDAHVAGKVYRTSLLFNLLVFRIWCDQYNPQWPAKNL